MYAKCLYSFFLYSPILIHYQSCRRFIRDVGFLFNLINGHYNIELFDKLLFCKDRRKTGYNLRNSVSQDLAYNFCRTDSFKYTFFNQIINELNRLPSQVRNAEEISIFKKRLQVFLE